MLCGVVLELTPDAVWVGPRRWSEASSHDMFKRFKEAPDGYFGKVQGWRYRDMILAPGATQPCADMLRQFREWSDGTFLASLGIE